MGLIVGGLSMMMARHFDSVGEMIAAALYLFTGAIFPLDVLPVILRPIGFILPVTYWLEVARRALLGANAAMFPTLAGFSDLQLMGILAAFAVGLVAFSLVFYRWMFHQAKERGMIDMETSY
jgi:ABC-2 type transport system permease protein